MVWGFCEVTNWEVAKFQKKGQSQIDLWIIYPDFTIWKASTLFQKNDMDISYVPFYLFTHFVSPSVAANLQEYDVLSLDKRREDCLSLIAAVSWNTM